MMRLARTMSAMAITAAALAAPAIAQTSTIEGVWTQAAPSTVLTPADGKPVPFTKAGKRAWQANRAAAAKGDFSFDATMASCASPGQPRLMLTNRPFAIFVRPRMVTMLYEWNRLQRQISIGPGMANPALGDDWWLWGSKQGHPVAAWRGDTLEVATDSFLDGRLLDAFLPGSDQLKLVEQIRLTSPDTFEDRITIADPVNYTRPWQAVVTYRRLPGSRLPFPEDVCLDRLGQGQPAIER